MHFHCSRIDNTTQQRPFPSDCLRIKSSHEFPPSFQTCASCRVLHNVQCLSFQKLCQCNVDLRIDFDRIGTSFDIVNVQYWCVLLSCPVKSISRRWDHSCCHVLKLESPILPRSRFGVKVHQLGEQARLQVSPQHLQHPCSSVPTRPTTELAAQFLSLLSLLADFPTSSTIAVSLAVESSIVAGDSPQLVPWSCQPVSMFVARIPASTIPEDVQPSAHAYQRLATQESTSQQSTLLRYHDAIIFFLQIEE